MSEPDLVHLRDVRQSYQVRAGSRRATLRALVGVDLRVRSGQSVGLVGESGCGKSTAARLMLGLEAPLSGQVTFRGHDMSALDATARRDFRRTVQAVFQDPYGAFNPRMRIGGALAEPLRNLTDWTDQTIRERIRELLAEVGLPVSALGRFPHAFSGGQRQRLAIARALGPHPELLVLDEPISALDVSIRAQIINLLLSLQQRQGLTFVLIAHQLPTVWSLCDDVAVMYLGRLVEYGPAAEIRRQPAHPYTRALLQAEPKISRRPQAVPPPLKGEVPSPLRSPHGCAFHPRCPMAKPVCREKTPVLRPIAGGQMAACHLI